MNSLYKEQVRLLLRTLPVIYQEDNFAVHGGTAINLFINNLPRYSVDVDLTYIHSAPRKESLTDIDSRLSVLAKQVQRAVQGIMIRPVPNKLLCTLGRSTVKIEVNEIKRGIIGPVIELPLCNKAQEEFGMFCKARIVPMAQLYGDKISAALSRQHPRDLFDFKNMIPEKIPGLKRGFIYALMGSDKPFIESLSPNLINQHDVLENQFRGMTDIPFTIEDYESARTQVITFVNDMLTEEDRLFLVSFEEGNPQWEHSVYSDLKEMPSVQWKLLNINKLKSLNPTKHKREVFKLKSFWGME